MQLDRRDFLAAAAGGLRGARQQEPPNLLFLMPDQWRAQDLGCMGNRQVRTPVLDKLASEGVLFTSAVANCPVCTPARGILLTGRYPHQTGTPVNDVPLRQDQPTLAKVLQKAGYYTGFVGKWHLHGGPRLPGFVPPGPARQGFEFWAANICSHAYFRSQYFRDDPTPIPIPGYDSITWTDLGIEFLEKARARKQPFCLYLQYTPPHDPYLLPPGHEKDYSPEEIQLRPNWREGAKRLGTRKDIAGYYSAINFLDSEIGRLLKRLDELGQRDNTIVYFLSDHGDMLGSQGTFLKRKPWEESTQVPGIFRWPRAIAPGRKLDAPFSHIDAVPTLLGLCGIEPPPGLEGFNYADYILGKSRRTPDYAMLMIYTKTELNEWDCWRGLRTRRYKYARFEHKPWVLYDLKNDPYELHNLVDSPAHRKLRARFDAIIDQHMDRVKDSWKELEDWLPAQRRAETLQGDDTKAKGRG
ncbi:MAG: sulfatase-like hydrolase/transferase [Bryobacteraceae bacterium]|nr:sulfatase-like hydrolase/transferase [Bryobacteraceae bacterium]MDW8378016.1 sulfatase-like hydrolase/transferase [Bryobacterales bacterium]